MRQYLIVERSLFFNEIDNLFYTNQLNDNCIIAGDLNCQIDNTEISDSSRNVLLNCIQSYGLIDLGKTFHETTQSTFYHKGLRKKSNLLHSGIRKHCTKNKANIC